MKFIFPQNFNFKNKIFGIIDYPTAIFNVIYFCLIYVILNIFIPNITFKIIMIILLYLPIFLISIIDFNQENILYFLWYMLKFMFRPKIYLYK